MKVNAPRLLSLDVFRGITVATMILVNNPGDWGHIYAPLEHAEWNGCTPTDLVFPFFLFIVGVSIAYALGPKKAAGGRTAPLIATVAKRAVILFLLGLFLNAFPTIFTEPIATLQTVRIPGVLQRIALVYLATGILFLTTSPRLQFRLLIGILLVYWGLMTLVPVPGVGYPNLEKETNLGAWIDRSLLGTAHLWKLSVTWDPEGLLGTLPAIATALSGTLTGWWLRKKDIDAPVKIAWLFAAGTLAAMTGLLLDLVFPINKALWTSSYVLYTSGLAGIGLALLYWMIDIQGYRRWTGPFVAYGVNAITVFFMSGIIPRIMRLIAIPMPDGIEVTSQVWLYNQYFAPYLSPVNASLAWALVFVTVWLVVLWGMYRKNIIIKV